MVNKFREVFERRVNEKFDMSTLQEYYARPVDALLAHFTPEELAIAEKWADHRVRNNGLTNFPEGVVKENRTYLFMQVLEDKRLMERLKQDFTFKNLVDSQIRKRLEETVDAFVNVNSFEDKFVKNASKVLEWSGRSPLFVVEHLPTWSKELLSHCRTEVGKLCLLGNLLEDQIVFNKIKENLQSKLLGIERSEMPRQPVAQEFVR